MAVRVGVRTPAQIFALTFGITYLVIGILGFAVTGFDGFASSRPDEELVIFALNPLHSIVHLGLGATWVAVASQHPLAKRVNVILGVALLLVFVLGMVGFLSWLAIDDASSPDNYLHLATAVLALYFGAFGAEGLGSS